MTKPRVILDTNILISCSLKPNPTITHAVRFAMSQCTPLVSQATFDEFRNVTMRFVKRKRYTQPEANELLGAFLSAAEWISIFTIVQLCRDPKDDKFLELALNGEADYLVTGDKYLLALHPFEGTKILSPRDFIALWK